MSEEKKQTQNRRGRIIVIISLFIILGGLIIFMTISWSESKKKIEYITEKLQVTTEEVTNLQNENANLEAEVQHLQSLLETAKKRITELEDSLVVLSQPDTVAADTSMAMQSDTTATITTSTPALHWRDRLRARARTKK